MLDLPRAELSRRCRQIWIDHERNPHGSLENDFVSALGEIQTRHGDAAPSEDDLWEIVRTEYDRVAQASSVAELLLPRISSLLQERAPSPINHASPHTEAPVTPSGASRAPISNIADLIEGMLDQQRDETRRAGNSHRP